MFGLGSPSPGGTPAGSRDTPRRRPRLPAAPLPAVCFGPVKPFDLAPAPGDRAAVRVACSRLTGPCATLCRSSSSTLRSSDCCKWWTTPHPIPASPGSGRALRCLARPHHSSETEHLLRAPVYDGAPALRKRKSGAHRSAPTGAVDAYRASPWTPTWEPPQEPQGFRSSRSNLCSRCPSSTSHSRTSLRGRRTCPDSSARW